MMTPEQAREIYKSACRDHLQSALVKHRDGKDDELTTGELTALVWFKVNADEY